MKEDKYFCYYLVAFVDLLGQKEEILKLNKLPDENSYEEIQFFEDQFRNTIVKAKSFFDAFDTFFNNLYSKENRIFSSHLFKTNIKYQRFADGIVIYTPLLDTKDNIPAEEVNGVLLACASTFISFLESGHPIRGGLDVDLGFELDENDIYGPAVVKSYVLESEIAQYPRIVIGEGMLKYLEYIKRYETNDYRKEINNKMAENSLRLIVRDSDGYPILDYMGQAFQEFTNYHLDIKVFRNIHEFVKSEHLKWKAKKNSKLAFRYKLMLDYVETKLTILEGRNDN